MTWLHHQLEWSELTSLASMFLTCSGRNSAQTHKHTSCEQAEKIYLFKKTILKSSKGHVCSTKTSVSVDTARAVFCIVPVN